MPSVSHDNKTLPFKPGQILLAIYHSQTKLNILAVIYPRTQRYELTFKL